MFDKDRASKERLRSDLQYTKRDFEAEADEAASTGTPKTKTGLVTFLRSPRPTQSLPRSLLESRGFDQIITNFGQRQVDASEMS